jgi:hypothetical protein
MERVLLEHAFSVAKMGQARSGEVSEVSEIRCGFTLAHDLWRAA